MIWSWSHWSLLPTVNFTCWLIDKCSKLYNHLLFDPLDSTLIVQTFTSITFHYHSKIKRELCCSYTYYRIKIKRTWIFFLICTNFLFYFFSPVKCFMMIHFFCHIPKDVVFKQKFCENQKKKFRQMIFKFMIQKKKVQSKRTDLLLWMLLLEIKLFFLDFDVVDPSASVDGLDAVVHLEKKKNRFTRHCRHMGRCKHCMRMVSCMCCTSYRREVQCRPNRRMVQSMMLHTIHMRMGQLQFVKLAKKWK